MSHTRNMAESKATNVRHLRRKRCSNSQTHVKAICNHTPQRVQTRTGSLPAGSAILTAHQVSEPMPCLNDSYTFASMGPKQKIKQLSTVPILDSCSLGSDNNITHKCMLSHLHHLGAIPTWAIPGALWSATRWRGCTAARGRTALDAECASSKP